MAITKNQIISAIQKGTKAAENKVEKWSNGRNSVHCWGVESLIVACIAEAVHKRQKNDEHLRLEVPLSEIKEESEAKPGQDRQPTTIKDSKRADIVLFNQSEQPTCVIEVKRWWNRIECQGDMERIRDLVRYYGHKNEGTLRRGFLAMMILEKETKSTSANDKIKKRMADIEERSLVDFASKELKINYHGKKWLTPKKYWEDDLGWKAASFCIEISSRN